MVKLNKKELLFIEKIKNSQGVSIVYSPNDFVFNGVNFEKSKFADKYYYLADSENGKLATTRKRLSLVCYMEILRECQKAIEGKKK
jgi:hypothetical protein